MEKCANFCKTTAGCKAFAFNNTTNTCFPSKSTLIGKPKDSPHMDQYRLDNTACNKSFTVHIPSKAIPFTQRRENAFFNCSEKRFIQPRLYFHNQGKLTKIDEGQNFDFMVDVDEYEVKPYRWSRGKYDMDQLRQLVDFRENQNLGPRFITNLDRIEGGSTSLNHSIEDTVNGPKRATLNPKKYISLETKDIPSYIQSTVSKSINTLTKSAKLNEVQMLMNDDAKPDNVIVDETLLSNQDINQYSPKDQYKLFKIYNDYNDGGEYLLPHKCNKNISHKNCLNYCLNNNNCLGVEWNPTFFNDTNICCPYRTIGRMTPRTESYNTGKFYLKEPKKQLSKNNIYQYYHIE
jgi:hypothetical protein